MRISLGSNNTDPRLAELSMANLWRRLLRPLSPVAVLLTVHCGGPETTTPSIASDGEPGPALLAHYGDTTAVTIPSVGQVDEVIEVRFTTFRGGCIGQGPTEIQLMPGAAEIRPMHLELTDLPPNTACPAILVVEQHSVPVQFSAPGLARIRLVGWARPEEEPFVIERTVRITP